METGAGIVELDGLPIFPDGRAELSHLVMDGTQIVMGFRVFAVQLDGSLKFPPGFKVMFQQQQGNPNFVVERGLVGFLYGCPVVIESIQVILLAAQKITLLLQFRNGCIRWRGADRRNHDALCRNWFATRRFLTQKWKGAQRYATAYNAVETIHRTLLNAFSGAVLTVALEARDLCPYYLPYLHRHQIGVTRTLSSWVSFPPQARSNLLPRWMAPPALIQAE